MIMLHDKLYCVKSVTVCWINIDYVYLSMSLEFVAIGILLHIFWKKIMSKKIDEQKVDVLSFIV